MNRPIFFKALLFVLIGLAPLGAFYAFLQQKQVPPILTSSISFDAKANFARTQGVEQIDVLGQGSSITLNNLNSQVMTRYLGESISYFNFSSWGLKMENSAEIMEVYLEKYQPKVVVMVSIPLDFEAETVPLCTPREYGWYLEGQFKPYFYLKNLDLQQLFSRSGRTDRLGEGVNDEYFSMNFDLQGGVDLAIPDSNLSEHRLTLPLDLAVEEKQYEALEAISRYLEEEGVTFVFAHSPVKVSNCATATCRDKLQAHLDRARSIVEGHGHVFVDQTRFDSPYPDSLFADGTHLNHGGSERFTRELLEEVDLKRLLKAKQ